MVKDAKTGKLVKKLMNVTKAIRKLKIGAKTKNMTKEEKLAYKSGKHNSDSDSDFSYRSAYSAGGTRKVRRRKKNDDGTYGDSDSYHSSQDGDGADRRRQRRQGRDGANSSDDDTKDNSQASGDDSDYSYASELSEGGTRSTIRKQRLRDEDGNIIGYGESEQVDLQSFSDTRSISPRRGSISDGSDGAYDRYMTDKLQQLNDIPDTMDTMEDTEDEERNRTLLDEHERLKERVFDPTWPGTNPSDKPNIELPNFDDQYRRLGGPRGQRGGSPDKMGVSKGKKELSDFSNMNEEEKQKFLEEQEKKNVEKEKWEREKREKREKQNLRREITNDYIEKEKERIGEELKDKRRESVMSQRHLATTPNGKHQSMVTYEKGAVRDINTPIQKTDNRQSGLSHSDWKKKSKDVKNNNTKKPRDNTTFDYTPGKLNAVSGKFGSGKQQDDTSGRPIKKEKPGFNDLSDKKFNDDNDQSNTSGEMNKFVFDESGKMKLKPGMKVDLSKLTAEDLRKLGIDPNLPKSQLLKKLREKLGTDAIIEGVEDILSDERISDDEDSLSFIMEKERSMAKTKDITGVRRVNLLFRHGGSRLQVHMQNVVQGCNLKDNSYATDLDERDSSIDYMCHYRLVDPGKIDSYAKAFVVEDSNLDTAITFQEIRTALDGVPTAQHITNKQKDYVFKVLHIDDATLVTFRMFAVITALCERVTAMDSLCKHLMDICNLGDIERKLNLYQAMFYQNTQCDRDTNFITSDSLKIELIAGGLNWKQQKFIMEKMEPNDWGEISFLDYMCYIPLFLSMHDNICDNPLDMSDTKYQVPPRKRPPSVQRDMNPLGQPLSQNSTFLLRKQARDLIEGRLNQDCLKSEKIELLHKYARLPDIPISRESKKAEEEENEKMDLIY